MGVFSVSGAKEDAQEAPNTDNTPTWVCSPRSTQGGRQRARQIRKAHSHACAVRVRCEGGEIERAEHREHTHVQDRKLRARGGMQRVGHVWHEGEHRVA